MERLFLVKKDGKVATRGFSLLAVVQNCRYALGWNQEYISALSDAGEEMCCYLAPDDVAQCELLDGYRLEITFAKCRCGAFAEAEPELDYAYYCPECDENMYEFEVIA